MSDTPQAPPAVILVRPREEGNIGATARAMANMGLSKLILVEPCPELGGTARAFGVGAHPVLEAAVRCQSLAEALAPFHFIVGTTSERDRVPRQTLEPRALADQIATQPADARTALVFGSEVSGLTTDELALCNRIVSIPTSTVHPTLNLAQAVLVLAYELYVASAPPYSPPAADKPATAGEIEGLFSQAVPLLEEIGFARDDTFSSTLRDLRQLVGRSPITSREVKILRGICRRAGRRLNQVS